MTEFLCKTRGEHGLDHKGRVYFTCHPDDFARSFEKIIEDILGAQNCAIYYTADMTEVDEEMYTSAALGRMNLFVIPVSFRLLREGCRAFVRDLAYAKKENIPVLPIMLETGIDEFYSRPEAFGERQYLSPYSTDRTGISYEEKLKKYLASVLVSEELANRVRAAFDAYIFLSYRKKDRAYADALMRLIHKNPECRDIAIWYDEFLTPGESFRENIFKALNKSDLFALLVTPSLLEKDNFVMREEYPAARDSGKPILPMEMVATDKDALRADYDGIPDPADPTANEEFRARLAASLSRLAVTENDSDPEHNFLIGLAYLEGIDVEVDRERALQLITKAAEAELPEAMKKLYELYREGKGVTVDYRKAVLWAERIVEYYKNKYGEKHADTLLSLHNLALTYSDLGDDERAQELHEKVYTLRCRILGKEHPDTLISLDNLAAVYNDLGDDERAYKLHEKVYTLRCRILGEEHPDTLISLNNLAIAYYPLGDYAGARKLMKKVYELRCRILGEEHPHTLTSLSNLASAYGDLGDYKGACEMHEKVYALRCRILGEEHPDTLTSLNHLASIYGNLGDHARARELKEKVYELRCRILGEEHPDTLMSLFDIADGELTDNAQVQDSFEKMYEIQCSIMGEEHPSTVTALQRLAMIYNVLKDYERALPMAKKAHELFCRLLGENHPTTLIALKDVATIYSNMGEHEKAVSLAESVYIGFYSTCGEKSRDAKDAARFLTFMRMKRGEKRNSLEKKSFPIGTFLIAIPPLLQLLLWILQQLGLGLQNTVNLQGFVRLGFDLPYLVCVIALLCGMLSKKKTVFFVTGFALSLLLLIPILQATFFSRDGISLTDDPLFIHFFRMSDFQTGLAAFYYKRFLALDNMRNAVLGGLVISWLGVALKSIVVELFAEPIKSKLLVFGQRVGTVFRVFVFLFYVLYALIAFVTFGFMISLGKNAFPIHVAVSLAMLLIQLIGLGAITRRVMLHAKLAGEG